MTLYESLCCDWLNRQTQQNIPGGQFDLAYDGNGNLITHTQTLTGQPAQTTTYTYDQANRPTKVHNDGVGTGAVGDIKIAPDGNGRVEQITFPEADGTALL